MDDQWLKRDSILEQALEAPREARKPLIATLCGEDVSLRDELFALVDAIELNSDFLEEPPLHLIPELLNAPLPDDLPPGTRIDAFEITDALGTGGMGTVYAAKRIGATFQQDVALKVVKRGLDWPRVLRRFHRERQILAQLEHPGVARLIDGGSTPDGRPYLVLERVEGKPITQYVSDLNLSVRDRIGLLIQVCKAVSYAHSRLVVHRDLKPGNVFVTHSGTVKLLDFGIAHLLTADEYELPITGDLGTPYTASYAAPEQIRGEAGTTLIDVYAIGVMLYEMLAGSRPYTTEEARLPDRPTLERPSARLFRTGETHTSSREVRGDLDSIVEKAMHPDPAQRYATVNALEADLNRFLSGHPVAARKGRLLYTLRKFVARNRTVVALSALLLGTILAFYFSLAESRESALRERDRANASRELIIDLFRSASPEDGEGGDTLRVRTLLSLAVDRILNEEGTDPTVRVETLRLLGLLHFDLGNMAFADSVLRLALQSVKAEVPDTLRAILQSDLALMQLVIGSPQVADSLLALALPVLRQNRLARHLGDAYSRVAVVKLRFGQYEEALEAQLQMVEQRRISGPPQAAVHAQGSVFFALLPLERYAEALRVTQDVRKNAGTFIGEVQPRLTEMEAMVHAHLGNFSTAVSLLPEADRAIRERWDNASPPYATYLIRASNVLNMAGEHQAADSLARRAIALDEQFFGMGHPSALRGYLARATALAGQGLLNEALPHFRASVQPINESSPLNRTAVAQNTLPFLFALAWANQTEEAWPLLEVALQGVQPTGHLRIGLRIAEAQLLLADGTPARADTTLNAVKSLLDASTLLPTHFRRAEYFLTRAATYMALRQPENAEQAASEGLRLSQMPSQHPQRLTLNVLLARARAAQRKPGAQEQLRRAEAQIPPNTTLPEFLRAPTQTL